MTLANATPNKRYKITRINGGFRLNSRLCAMGLIPNETFSVMNYSMGGPLTVVIKGVKLAIGRGMARKIIIREVR